MKLPMCFTPTALVLDVAAEPVQRTLVTPLLPQEKSLWCWAAVSSMVTATYNPNEGTPQTSIVHGMLCSSTCALGEANKPKNCCVDRAAPGDFPNSAARLGCGFTFVRHLDTYKQGTVDFATLIERIDRDQPVALHVASGGNGHFVVVTGYDDQGHVQILDPWPVASGSPVTGGMEAWVLYDSLIINYHGDHLTGKWDYTYFSDPTTGN